ncbi:MAG: hypothetical protein WCI51_21805, partial [Lentisphaerota bacterium]
PGVIQRRGVGRRNGEIKNVATESGAPRFTFTLFMFFMVRLYLPFSCFFVLFVVKVYFWVAVMPR